MEVAEENKNVYELAENKIKLGNELINKLDTFKSVAGVQKIQRKIRQEIKFLERVKLSHSLKINHVMCSNITHYEFLVKVLLKQINIIHVDCGFIVEERPKPIRIDIVCENGSKWIKVIARNSKSITDAAKGRASFGAKSIVDQAEEYCLAASQNPCMFKCPKVIFYFSHEIDNETINSIKMCGVEPITINFMNESNCNVQSTSIKILNLDITTMLAYVSALTNGRHNWIFQEHLLTEQAERENKTPLKLLLDELFEGKRLICCQTALLSFKEICSILAGPEEKKRAELLIKRLEIFDDVDEIPIEFSVLPVGGKIKPRSLKIFAFGLVKEAITITSNEGFIRSAKMQGINLPVIIHQARALTESKEQNAVPKSFSKFQ